MTSIVGLGPSVQRPFLGEANLTALVIVLARPVRFLITVLKAGSEELLKLVTNIPVFEPSVPTTTPWLIGLATLIW